MIVSSPPQHAVSAAVELGDGGCQLLLDRFVERVEASLCEGHPANPFFGSPRKGEALGELAGQEALLADALLFAGDSSPRASIASNDSLSKARQVLPWAVAAAVALAAGSMWWGSSSSPNVPAKGAGGVVGAGSDVEGAHAPVTVSGAVGVQ